MISTLAISAVVLRHVRLWKRDLNTLLIGFSWPALDIIIWGFLGSWIQSTASQFHNYEMAALLGILLMQAAARGSTIMAMVMSEEIWQRNIINLFSLPLRITDWILGAIIFFLIMMFFTFLFCVFVIYLLYQVSISQLLSIYFYFLPPLIFSGIWMGLMCMQIFALLGRKGVELAYVVAWFLVPFSGAYYPVEVLPQWAQTISKFLPMSYAFKDMRNYVMYNQSTTSHLVVAYGLSILYACIALLLFIGAFNHSKKKGLARLVD